MGNRSKRSVPREPSAPIVETIGPPTRPPQFAVVRHVTAGVSKIDVLNLDHIVHAVAHAYGEEHAIELWTHGDLIKFPIPDKPSPITFTGEPAANLLAHLILCGIDVEGAPAALARARGDLYAPYFKGCEHAEAAAGVVEVVAPISVEENAAELRENRASAELGFRGAVNALRERQQREVEQAQRASAELRSGEVERDLSLGFKDRGYGAHGLEIAEETRASCAFGASCKRFPACGDCSLYAIDRACESLHRGDVPDGDGDRRVVHVEHVEQVSGETAAQLTSRVERCSVFVGMKDHGVVPGEKWCGVGHEMTDPACALCPYLRIYAPTGWPGPTIDPR